MTDEPRWFTRSDWTTAHLLRPGITCVHRDDKQARVTLCGRPIAHPYPSTFSFERCGQCTRRRDNDGMTCVCGHDNADHQDGTRACTVTVLDLRTHTATGALVRDWADCPCRLLEADNDSRRNT